jgi:hypothetical protein
MVESRISRSVGAPPAPNLPSDVRAVQSLLRSVQPPLLVSVSITGTMDSNTLGAITEYQRRFMTRPDGRIDPNGVTLMRMNWEPVVDQDFGTAKQWLNVVVGRLGNVNDTDMKRKVRNVFHIEFDSPADASKLKTLVFNYRRLLQSFLQYIPRRYYPKGNIFQAWVVKNDQTGTMHFPRNYFNSRLERRIETIIHERSHTIFNINHSGMAGAGAVDFGHNPDDDNGLTFEEAIANAYCYGWLAAALQPGYLREAEDVISVPSPRR